MEALEVADDRPARGEGALRDALSVGQRLVGRSFDLPPGRRLERVTREPLLLNVTSSGKVGSRVRMSEYSSSSSSEKKGGSPLSSS